MATQAGYIKALSERWSRQNFRTQLMVSHGGLVLCSLLASAYVGTLMVEQVLYRRGFDLLEATNRASVARFLENLQLEQSALPTGHTRCDASEQQEWKEIRASRFYVSTETLPAPAQRREFTVLEGAKPRLRFVSPCGGKEAILLSAGWLSKLFNDRTGLGTSGETYLLAEDGRLITESRFQPDPKSAPVPSQLPAHWVGIKRDYRGIPVLASWTRVSVGEFRGFVASEIDDAEIRGPVRRFFFVILGFSALVLVLTAFGLRWLARALSRNVERAQEMDQVKNLALIEGQERERCRLSLELHDDIGQQLTALGWRVAGGADKEELTQHVRDVALQVRKLSGDLSNMLVQEVGLAQALRQLVEDADRLQMSGARFQLEISGEPGMPLSQQLSTAVYRVGQETLANIVKHAQATQVRYRLSLNPKRVALVVEDDGVGMPAETRAAGLGLKSMRARAEAFGGSLTIGTGASRGTRVEMDIPLGGENESTAS